MTECSGFHPWFHKRAFSSFNLINLIALCQFCKLDRCVQLKEEIKGKVVGPESFGYDRVNSSQGTVLTSVAAGAQPKLITSLGRGSQELRGTPSTGHALTNEVLPHRVWIQQAETSAGKKTRLQPQTLSEPRPGSSQRVLLGAAGDRAEDRATHWVQRLSGRQSQATTYVQGAWTGGRLLTVWVHGPPCRQGWRQAQLQRGSGRDPAGFVGGPR